MYFDFDEPGCNHYCKGDCYCEGKSWEVVGQLQPGNDFVGHDGDVVASDVEKVKTRRSGLFPD